MGFPNLLFHKPQHTIKVVEDHLRPIPGDGLELPKVLPPWVTESRPRTEPFAYKPIATARNEIRLVKFIPSLDAKGPNFFFRMQSFDIDDVPFEAVSYVWGPPEPSFVIAEFNSDKRLFIRRNLWTFLNKRVRSKAFMANTWFWIDQICIDQSNMNEKNHQIRLMEAIFSNAKQVHVWLGNYQDNDPYVGQVHGIGTLFHGDDLQFAKAWTRNPYWTRLWIVQEIILAKKLVIHMNMRFVDGFWFDEMDCDILNSMHPVVAWILESRRVRIQRPRDFDMQAMSLGRCLFETIHSACENPKDKIFGLQSLLEPQDRINVDYNKPLTRVLIEGIAMLLLRTKLREWELVSVEGASRWLCRWIDEISKNMGFVTTGRTWLSPEILDFIGMDHVKVDDAEFERLVQLLLLAWSKRLKPSRFSGEEESDDNFF